MIRHNCPECQHVLHSSDALAGMAVACPQCRTGVRVPRRTHVILTRRPTTALDLSLSDPVPEPAPEKPPHWLTGRLILVLAVPILVVGLVLVYLAYSRLCTTNVEVHADNGTDETMTVKLNGWTRATVPPRRFEVIACKAGSNHLQVEQAGRVIYDQVHEMQAPSGKTPTRCLLRLIVAASHKEDSSSEELTRRVEVLLRTVRGCD
jgi:hypothetical protein